MKGVVFAFCFFTNIPCPGKNAWQETAAARALGWLPLTGLAVGLLQAAVFSLMESGGFPRFEELKAVLLILTELLAGGTLFLDGFADSCDGLFSRRDREETLRIMKDSRIGAMGVLGLLMYFLLKYSLYQELMYLGEIRRVLVFAPVMGRFAVTLTAFLFAPAKSQGLAAFFRKEQQPGDFLLALVFALVLGAALPGRLGLAGLAAASAACIFGALVNRKLKGHTGDTYGFVSLLTEQAFCLFAAFFLLY
ncbi:MAG: adenosylcobinamide-GDP ribazoletransferase [Peptococcaceae bacterium]|nr:adenosylcobinamide-GDP ribazoletransferase [Peptococcaceae bacterium]